MNTGRFVGAGVAVFVVRFLLNFLFYGVLVHGQYEAHAATYPGMFREVIPAYAVLDLISAFLLVYLFAKAGAAFGGGMRGGVCVGIFLAILAIICNLYWFYSVTIFPMNLLGLEAVYMLVAFAIQGAVAAAVYKTA